MSTEHQRYSIENQQQKIAEYASERGYDIVDTYADAGRSGLTLRERRELNRLLRDVTDPTRRFSTILVLDVSRWGRFQDPDQHAAYEFVCRDLGVQVEYVAEAFANDGTFTSSLMKHMKRIMAGEYSRDLSAKTSYTQIRSARRGHKQGGMVGLGLRRMLISADGCPKQELAPGERKSLASDRVTVVPGPEEERAIIRHLFDLFLQGAPLTSVARHLNHIGAPSTCGTPWTYNKVRTALTNELYTGVYVYNRSSQKLKTPHVRNPENLWVRVSVCEGIISSEDFQKAQELLATPRRAKSNTYSAEKMLAGLRRLYSEKGCLTLQMIDACPYIPNSTTYRSVFGPADRLYALVGYVRRPVSKYCRRPWRCTPYTAEELVPQLRRLLAEKGYLSTPVIQRCSYAASIHAYLKVFGSMAEAFKAAGYTPPPKPARRYDLADSLRNLKTLFDRHGYVSTAMLREEPSTPTSQWYRDNFGSFAAACAQAGINYKDRLAANAARAHREYLDRPEGGYGPNRRRFSELSDEQLLGAVRRKFEENGYINGRLIFSDPEMPSAHRVSKRYATLAHLYAAAGLPADVPTRTPAHR